jgi:uncharacterized spore protein YtfJ
MKEEINKQVEMLFEKLKDFITSKTVVGEEIKIGKLTLIPIIEVTFGVIKDEEVKLLSLRKPGSLEKLIEKFPEIVEKYPRKPGKRGGKEEKKE